MSFRTLIAALGLLVTATPSAFAEAPLRFDEFLFEMLAARYQQHNEHPRHTYRRYEHAQPVTLRMKVRVDGKGSIALRRLIERKHNIDTRDYRIRTVYVGNKARYPACATLSVNRRSSGVIDLRRGTTAIAAPRGRGDGRWVLDVENARVRWIEVVLEPRRPRGGHDYSYRDQGRGQERYRDYRDQRQWR